MSTSSSDARSSVADGNSTNQSARSGEAATPQIAPSVATHVSGPSKVVSGGGPKDPANEINRRRSRVDHSVEIGAAVFVILMALSVPLPIVVAISAASLILASLAYQESKYSALRYANDADTAGRLESLQNAVAALRAAESVWSVEEASLSNGLTAHPPTLRRTRVAKAPPRLPPYVRTNISPPALQLPAGTMYFFPDRLYVWQDERVAAIEYESLRVRFSRVTFLEREHLPADAVIESRMRCSLVGDNTFPVLYYGLVDIDATPALQVRLLMSRVQSAEGFVSFIQGATGTVQPPERAKGSEGQLYTHFDPVRVPLYYRLNNSDVKRFQSCRAAFALISSCDCVWLYEMQEAVDQRRNAGASLSAVRTRIYPALFDQAPGFESNVAFGLSLGESALFVLPDALVTLSGQRFQNVGTRGRIHTTMCDFSDAEWTPKDAMVVGKTWYYVRKDGKPDLRFADNPRIPIYRYGLVEITCGSWNVQLCLSRAAAAEEFAAAVRNIGLEKKQDGTQEHSSEKARPRATTEPSSVAAALTLLGLEPDASFEEACRAYRNLAAQNHPDKVAQMAPEFRDLAERKMRELNQAYEKIRNSYKER
jgi:hypothetical protein